MRSSGEEEKKKMFSKESNCWCPLLSVLLLHFFTVFAIVSYMRRQPAELRELWHTRYCWFCRDRWLLFNEIQLNLPFICLFLPQMHSFQYFSSASSTWLRKCLPNLCKHWHLKNLNDFWKFFLENISSSQFLDFPDQNHAKLSLETLNCIPFPLEVFPLERFVLLYCEPFINCLAFCLSSCKTYRVSQFPRLNAVLCDINTS